MDLDLLKCTAISIGLLSSLQIAQSEVTVFSQSDFTTAWTTTDPTNGTVTSPGAGGGGSYLVNAETTGGNPDSYLSIRLNIGSNSRIVETFSFVESFTHNPSTQGAINHIDYSFDTQRGAATNPGNAQGYGIALKQGNFHYYIYNADADLTWKNVTQANVSAADFVPFYAERDAATLAGSYTPNFSETGETITFGYYRGNSTVFTSAFVVGHLDNYSVSIDHETAPVPEANHFGSLLGALALCICINRRKHKR